MRILFLPNWKVEYCESAPVDKQPPDYHVKGEPYWFFRYFDEVPEVDVLDIRSTPRIESFEKNKIRFYILQALRAIPRLSRYDLIISHGMQSGVVISLFRRLFGKRSKHVVFDIGSFNSAAESGAALKLMQFASMSIDGIIYHTRSQKSYYKKFFPWILPKSKYIRFGTDAEFFAESENSDQNASSPYCLCVGYSKRDWDTVIEAFKLAKPKDLTLRLIGHEDEKYRGIPGVEQVPFVPIKELMKEIADCSFSILPLKSYNYSYGQMTLLQQMAMGKCVIASRVPSLVDYAEDNKSALFYEPENVQDLADKIKLVSSDNDLRMAIGKNAAEFVSTSCNEKIMAKEIENFLKKL